MLRVVEDLEPLTVPERKLLEAVESGEDCDFFGDGEAHWPAGDKTDWGDDRRIRAAVLKAILSGDREAWGIGAGAAVTLSGAVVAGDLTGFRGKLLPPISLQSCRFHGRVDFSEATFTGDAGFHNAIFGGGAWFGGAAFGGGADFGGADFDGNVVFDGADFGGDAGFLGADFGGDAGFLGADFSGDAVFDGADFGGDAWFNGANFSGDARFDGADFSGDAWYEQAAFSGAWFRDAAFGGHAVFGGATFGGVAEFRGAVAHRLSFSGAVFSAPDPGPWMASTVSLDRAVLAVRSRIEITATEIDASRLQAREGAHLVLHCARVDLSDSEFLRRSIVASPPAERAAIELRNDLESEFDVLPPRCGVTSLARANVAELVLSDVVLDECAFAGAHGLDKLRIGTGCSFQGTPRRWRRRPMARRRAIAEELRWRQVHTGRDKTGDFVPAPEIAGIYRDLRKGLEDAKNEPGAADFYYGEMEMRRLAGRKPTGPAASPLSTPSWAERALLYGYWAVSGYGLRAWRALITLAVVLFGAALLYTLPAFATVSPPTARIAMIDPTNGVVSYTPPAEQRAPGLWTALEYSVRESISLLQARSMPAISTTGAGTVVDFVLRLAGPVLLAFTVLALRARTKR